MIALTTQQNNNQIGRTPASLIQNRKKKKQNLGLYDIYNFLSYEFLQEKQKHSNLPMWRSLTLKPTLQQESEKQNPPKSSTYNMLLLLSSMSSCLVPRRRGPVSHNQQQPQDLSALDEPFSVDEVWATIKSMPMEQGPWPADFTSPIGILLKLT